MRLGRLLESLENDVRKLALLVQTAFIEDLDWDMELSHKNGFVIGELKMSTGQAHGDVFVFIASRTVLVIHEPGLLDKHTVADVIDRYQSAITYVMVNPTREGASKFVSDYYI